MKERGHSLDLSLSVSLNGGKERERVERATGGGFFDESTNADYDDAASQEDKRVTEERERERGEKRKIRREGIRQLFPFPPASYCSSFVLINAKRVGNKSQTIKIARGKGIKVPKVDKLFNLLRLI